MDIINELLTIGAFTLFILFVILIVTGYYLAALCLFAFCVLLVGWGMCTSAGEADKKLGYK